MFDAHADQEFEHPQGFDKSLHQEGVEEHFTGPKASENTPSDRRTLRLMSLLKTFSQPSGVGLPAWFNLV